jgi:hypothetical protein
MLTIILCSLAQTTSDAHPWHELSPNLNKQNSITEFLQIPGLFHCAIVWRPVLVFLDRSNLMCHQRQPPGLHLTLVELVDVRVKRYPIGDLTPPSRNVILSYSFILSLEAHSVIICDGSAGPSNRTDYVKKRENINARPGARDKVQCQPLRAPA